MQTTLNCFFLILPTQLRPKYHLPAKFPSANLLLDVCQSPNSQFSKTEFLLTGLKKQLDKIHSSTLNTTRSARNLGFISDEHLTFSDQISAISNACTGERVQYYHIRQLRCIRPYLDSTTACTIATSIVHSKLDYCNSLYYSLPMSQIIRLQLIQLLHYLWPPCIAGCGHIYFHPVVSFYLPSFFYSSPNLNGRRLDVYHTSTHGVALVRI